MQSEYPNRPKFKKLPAMEPLWSWGDYTNLVIVTGRDTGKSHQGAKWAIRECINNPGTRGMVTRQFYDSLNESIYATIRKYLNLLKYYYPHMEGYWKFSESVKDCWLHFRNGSEMVFYGVDRHPENLKGPEDISFLLADEVQTYPLRPMTILTDTLVRKTGVKLLWLGNRRNRTDAWEHQLIRYGEMGDEDFKLLKLDYRDNDFLYTEDEQGNRVPDMVKHKAVWRRIFRLQKYEPDMYNHEYLAGYNEVTDAVIFKRKTFLDTPQATDEFEKTLPADARRLYAIDWSLGGGDPHVLLEILVWDGNIYFSREVALYGSETDTNVFPQLFVDRMAAQGLEDIQNCDIVCDVAPVLIRHLEASGFKRLTQVTKTKNMRLKTYRAMGSTQMTFSHRCQGAYEEARDKMYEIDPHTGKPKSPPVIPDGDDHRLDGASYAVNRDKQTTSSDAHFDFYED